MKREIQIMTLDKSFVFLKNISSHDVNENFLTFIINSIYILLIDIVLKVCVQSKVLFNFSPTYKCELPMIWKTNNDLGQAICLLKNIYQLMM